MEKNIFILNPYLGEQNKCKHGFGGKDIVEITKDKMSWLILAAFAKEINMNREEKNIVFYQNNAYLANWPSSLIRTAGETIFISSRKEGTLSRISFL